MRSCQASAYGQWLQVNTTTVGPPPSADDQVVPSVSGRSNFGALSPIAIVISSPLASGGSPQRVAQIFGVRGRADTAVATAVDAAAEPDLVVGGRARDIDAVDQDRRRAAE